MTSPCAGSDLAAELPAVVADVRVVYGDVPRYLPDAIVRGVLYEASRSEALLDVPGIARLHIRRDVLTVQPLGHDIAAVLGPYLRSTPLMVLMLLRGGFGTSAAALAGPDGAIVVMGRTVSGKSTLAAALMKRGWRLMADDAAPLVVDPDGTVSVYPVWPEMILWQEAVDILFGRAPAWLGDAAGEIPRRTIARERYCREPMPLKRLYMLRPERLEGAAESNGVDALLPYQPELAVALSDPAALSRLRHAIGETRTLAFPQTAVTEMDDLAERIIADLSHG
ncbi:hypothetical protein [Rhizomicrobium electricum]|uniref:Hpr(Ser) kinase/phosphatase n=1 Tax=Rhizomicrobium electricum TaxID=480070 RepID=A0ABP3QB78_9PROT|nr:hypothetical protein [Rhizomicrobium electricum]NIJ46719.1 hypothetical protein [Rhizomicrobium electricum]